MTKSELFLSIMQMEVLGAVKHWIENEAATKQVFKLFGYAGTGKSTLAEHVAQIVDGSAIYLTYTGKAASVLRQKGCEDAQTLHSAMYKPFVSQSGHVDFILNKESNITSAKLIILDECSMVDDELLSDLKSFGVPILAMGDPAQLPPVKGVGILASGTPDRLMTEVHRQAADSPILQLATLVRGGGSLAHGTSGESRVMAEEQLSVEDILAADQIIVGTNRKRREYNDLVRAIRGYKGELPNQGERLACVKNHSRLGISNGEIYTVLTKPVVSGDDATFEVECAAEPEVRFEVTISISQFISGEASRVSGPKQKPDFVFGYALTCHKAQGSQWGDVLIVDESFCAREDADRWLYTAITRAQHRVTIAK